MAKQRKGYLTCQVCGKRFAFKAKTHPLGRMAKHKMKAHPKQWKASLAKAKRTRNKAKATIRPLDREFMAIDDLLLSDALGKSQDYDAIHEQLGGLIIEALLPIAVEGIARAIKKRKAKKDS